MNRATSLRLEILQERDHDAVAVLVHRSLVEWYRTRLGQGARFDDRARANGLCLGCAEHRAARRPMPWADCEGSRNFLSDLSA